MSFSIAIVFLLAVPTALFGCRRSLVAGTARSDASAPVDATRAIFRPEFVTATEPLRAGTAFFVTTDGWDTPLGITAIHLFGPAGGLDAAMKAQQLPSFVRSVLPHEIATDRPLSACGPMLLIPGASIPTTGDRSTDIAAFVAPSTYAGQALRLAAKSPAVGDPVWLVAQVRGGAAPDTLLHRAEVLISNSRLLAYTFDNAALELRATSGAPVVASNGEVVGINESGGVEKGRLIGNANPVESIRAQLAKATALRP